MQSHDHSPLQVAIFSPYPERLAAAIESTGDRVIVFNGDDPRAFRSPVDWIVSYGYRKIIDPAAYPTARGRLVNLHISLLPWNRGADPNFWSWFDDTPKGVTLHHIDKGLDTGAIIAAREVAFDPAVETLGSSYDKLQEAACALFRDVWPGLRRGEVPSIPQSGAGSYHRRAQREAIWDRFPLGWETPVSEIREYGRKLRLGSV